MISFKKFAGLTIMALCGFAATGCYGDGEGDEATAGTAGTAGNDNVCANDMECKGNRVCRSGMCVDPGTGGTSGSGGSSGTGGSSSGTGGTTGGSSGSGTGGTAGGCVEGLEQGGCKGPNNCDGFQICQADHTYGACQCYNSTGGTGGVGGTSGTGGASGSGNTGNDGGTAGGGAKACKFPLWTQLPAGVAEQRTVLFHGMLNNLDWKPFCSSDFSTTVRESDLAYRCDVDVHDGDVLEYNVLGTYKGPSDPKVEGIVGDLSNALWETQDPKVGCFVNAGPMCFRTFGDNKAGGQTMTLANAVDNDGSDLSKGIPAVPGKGINGGGNFRLTVRCP